MVSSGNTYLTDGRVVEWVDYTVEEVREASTVRGEAAGPEPAQEVQRRANNVPRDLSNDLRGEQRSPTVHATRPFTNLVYIAGLDEGHLELVGEWYADNCTKVDGLKG